MSKQNLKTAGVILGVYALCAFVQLRVVRLPYIGVYLPGGISSNAVAQTA
jgi:hypothetical protein